MVEVNNGYARNFILPKKLGVEATGKNINDLKLQKAHQDKVAAEQLAAAQALAAELSEKSVEVKMKVGEGGKTFGAISTKEIAAAAKNSWIWNWTRRRFPWTNRSGVWVYTM